MLTTPAHRFAHLKDYPFRENYITLETGLRMHYVDEGQGPLVLLLHGEPSWSYLYRKMIPVLVEGACRCVAPDLIGFGKSTKPTQAEVYTYANHLSWIRSFIDQLGLVHINLFGQDWGGLIGLRLAAEQPDRYDRIIAANTILPTGKMKPNEAFEKWKKWSQETPVFPVGKIINGATVSPLSEEVIAAYDAPFPDESYKVGARVFPSIVPVDESDPESANNERAWAELARWEKPFLTLFSDSDPIMSGAERIFHKMVPGTRGQPHAIIRDAGHFLQEDKGEEVARHILHFIHQH